MGGENHQHYRHRVRTEEQDSGASLTQKAARDHSQSKNPQMGNKHYKWGEYIDVVIDTIGDHNYHSKNGTPGR